MASLDYSFTDDDIENSGKTETVGETASADIKSLILQRKSKRTVVTKTVNLIYLDKSTLSTDDCHGYITKLQRLEKELVDLDNTIIAKVVGTKLYTDAQLVQQFEVNEMYRDKIGFALSSVQSVTRNSVDSSGDSTKANSQRFSYRLSVA